jgi:toxin CcdB
MSQFTVYQNKNNATKKAVPLLLDIQSNLLQDLQTTVVIPLYQAETNRDKALTKLTPLLKIAGAEYLAFTTHLAGISRRELGKAVATVEQYRQEIIAAIDFMLAGV